MTMKKRTLIPVIAAVTAAAALSAAAGHLLRQEAAKASQTEHPPQIPLQLARRLQGKLMHQPGQEMPQDRPSPSGIPWEASTARLWIIW